MGTGAYLLVYFTTTLHVERNAPSKIFTAKPPPPVFNNMAIVGCLYFDVVILT